MHIDRSNYEIWLIDWLDGNLNRLQVEQLKLFLDQNPDLREEINDLAQVRLTSSGISFRYKEQLKKSPSDISRSQFEYLCAAFIENDLTKIQQEELLEIVSKYPEKKKTFDLIQKTILSGEKPAYKHKKLLLKRTGFQKIMRLSATGLSSAAAIALVIIIFSSIHRTTIQNLNLSAHNPMADTIIQSQSSVKETTITLTDNIPPVQAQKKSENRIVNFNKKNNTPANKSMHAPNDDSLFTKSGYLKITINKTPVYQHVDMVKGITGDSLIAFNPSIYIPDTEDESSRVGKFISKTFREKILRENTPADSPLKGYEIAEAGINGLNKLLGWQMVFDMKNDENGQPRSVYFNSKILKLEAPVKKRESLP
jgi:hypothetical protein